MSTEALRALMLRVLILVLGVPGFVAGESGESGESGENGEAGVETISAVGLIVGDKRKARVPAGEERLFNPSVEPLSTMSR